MFIIELPDGDGNTFLPKAVIEVEEGERYTLRMSSYTIIAPKRLRQSWPTYMFCHDEIMQVEGPARELTRKEYDQLVSQYEEH